jgi:hypothetical protein
MVSGNWYNQDGLYLQYGTQKAVPEVGGDYLIYGETREIEQLVPLVPFQLTSSGQLVPAPAQTTFSGTGTAAAAGIQSLTTFLPLQQTAPVVTTTGGNLVLSNPQIFIEEVTVENLITATGGTSVSVGLVTTSPQTGANAQFAQVTPNAGVQIINGLLIANIVAGTRITYTQPGSTGMVWSASSTAPIAGGGTWVGVNMPLVTNSIVPLPASAWISTINTGTFTNGLFKLRIRYTIYGNIPY